MNNNNTRKILLMILDGWGIGNKSKSNAIYIAKTPFMDNLQKKYPNSQLEASGEKVGLPNRQMGNSEVGHLTIGAGRIIYQDLVRINIAVRENTLAENKMLIEAFNSAKKINKSVHFIGLVSNGGVHSMDTHLYKLCDITKDYGLENVFIHALTDGRDTDPRSGLGFMKNLVEHLIKSNGKIATLAGRYYTMDRDKRWERVKEGYDLMVKGKGKKTTDILEAIKQSYDEGVTDEFIKPIVVTDKSGQPLTTIKEGDVVICFNFRTDRLRQITTVLTQKDFFEYEMHTLDLKYYTMTNYDNTFERVNVLYDKENLSNTLGELIAKAGKKQIRIAETEKYAHVTFFFSGGREEKFENEERILIPSPKVPTYDLKPEMSAFEVRDAIIKELKKQDTDFVCLNFANGDMVGHTGEFKAILEAVEAVDSCVKDVVETAKSNSYEVLIIADH
ncbi:MAG: 2,3-bisphosphoglycerate-independent phosphoglycerate mutase, partial [Bacteroidales bacterium]|nr:2,3-bisphosphoglycerate-independent phosphoglycerate mutase [Bacteroidales bacterium]